MIWAILVAVFALQDPRLTQTNIDQFLRAEVAKVTASLPRDDEEGNSLVSATLSGRTVTQVWRAPDPLTLERLNTLEQVALMACEDAVVQSAIALETTFVQVYSHGAGPTYQFRVNAKTCGGLRLDSSDRWRTLQATDTRLSAVNAGSVVADGDLRWFEFADARPSADGTPAGFRKFNYLLDCRARTFGAQSVSTYDRDGELIDFDYVAQPFDPINPGTVMEAASRGICDDRWRDRTDRDLDTILRAAWAAFDESEAD